MKPSILYFDDEEIQLTLFEDMFGDEYEVHTASTLFEAHRLLSECPEIIISDWSMPEISGVEFLREAARVCPDAFRILLTGFAHAGEMIGEISSGVVQLFLPKPWNESEMRAALVRALLLHSR